MILYRESSLLCDKNNTPASLRVSVAITVFDNNVGFYEILFCNYSIYNYFIFQIAHEVAHQW